jgi:hypothetical protein
MARQSAPSRLPPLPAPLSSSFILKGDLPELTDRVKHDIDVLGLRTALSSPALNKVSE